MNNVKEQAFYKEIGSKIAIARKKTNNSQDKLAQKLGLSRFSIVNIEAGRQKPSVYLIVQISLILNVEFQDLLPTLQTESGDGIKNLKEVIRQVGKNRSSAEFLYLSQRLIKNDQ